jgi:GNAT superfamily N-acetyltransferase
LPFTTKELSVGTFQDFSKLALKQGGCWCIYYQRPKPIERGLSTAEWGRINRRDKARLVRKGKSHAILVYDGRTPVGWCQYGTNDELPRIDAGRNYKRAAPRVSGKLWRITCFFVDRRYRGRGVSKEALKGALAAISEHGGGTVEAYPVISPRMAAVPEWRWFGTPGMFEKEGFKRIARLGTSGVLMRKVIVPSRKGPG